VTYTLFVDESGDFTRASRRWIVSGVLCRGKPQAAEKQLRIALEAAMPRYLLRSLGDAHLTELRRSRGHEQAGKVAQGMLDAADGSGTVTAMLAVENDRGEGLQQAERTYRLMLLDLVALADAALPDGSGNERLEVIVARRQKAGELMSTRDDLLADVLKQVEDAVESGLAARGLLGRLDARHLRIWKASDSAGLVVADFVANLTYNRDRAESARLVDALVDADRLRLFQGLGGYAERRARIAERDGDLAVALARWAMLDSQYEEAERRDAELIRLWRKVMGQGAAGPSATLEAVLERLWRQRQAFGGHSALTAVLRRLETALRQASAAPALLYRLRNMMHLVANQSGDLATAERVMRAQVETGRLVATDPSCFHLVLDGALLRVISAELRLDFAAFISHARAHRALVEQYAEVWELLEGESGRDGFLHSRLWLKANMTLVRGLLLSGGSEMLQEAEALMDSLAADELHPSDQERLENYRLWLDLRRDHIDAALDKAELQVERFVGPYTAYFVARTTAEAIMAGFEQHQARAKVLLRRLRARAEDCMDHPGELIWRELGVLECRVGRGGKAARDCLLRSLQISDGLPVSPANIWTRHVTAVHLDELTSDKTPKITLPEPCRAFGDAAVRAEKELGRLRALRAVSPY
jgi:hypothetical protein